MELKITKIGINAEGIGFIDRKPVFVNGCFIDEIVEISNIKKEGKIQKADLVNIIKPSPDRITGICKMETYCKACPFMDLKYKKQLEYKKEILKESLKKYSDVNTNIVKEVKSVNQIYYRNQLKLPLKWIHNEVKSGLYETGSNHLIYMDRCLAHEKELEQVRKGVLDVLNKHGMRDYNEKIQKGFRYIVARGFDHKYQVTLVTGKTIIPHEVIADILKDKRIISLYQNINTQDTVDIMSLNFKKLALRETLPVNMNGLELQLYPNSFFQLNTEMAKCLYNDVVNLIDHCDVMVEAYCGIGTMSLMAHDKCEKIIAIENVENAIINAKENAKANNINNIEFICDDAAFHLASVNEKIDVLLVDPPRTGLNLKMIETVLKKKPEKIIYVSCNPSTLARNINELKDEYKVEMIQPYDMFPQTPHVETCVLLVRECSHDDEMVSIKVDMDGISLKQGEYKPDEKPTYGNIKKWIKEKYGFNVTSLYIGQIKDKVGIKERKNYNIGSGEGRIPNCPAEKEEAIMEAFRHFGMI